MNSVIHCQSSRRIIHSYFDNVIAKFMTNNTTEAWKTDVNLLINEIYWKEEVSFPRTPVQELYPFVFSFKFWARVALACNVLKYQAIIFLLVFLDSAIHRRGIKWSLRAFASMRAVRLFLRAQAVINFVLRVASTLEITDGEQWVLHKFSVSWNRSFIKTLFVPSHLADTSKTGQQAQS